MKRAVLAVIVFYQLVISPILKQILGTSMMCRYSPTCSEYAKIVIGKYGLIKGGLLALRCFLSCYPRIFAKNQRA